jgi:hypothetical protein
LEEGGESGPEAKHRVISGIGRLAGGRRGVLEIRTPELFPKKIERSHELSPFASTGNNPRRSRGQIEIGQRERVLYVGLEIGFSTAFPAFILSLRSGKGPNRN